jgi:hypothetical protein
MKVELSRFHVKPGKSARVDEWMAMLNGSTHEVVQTLERERMKLEVIFREIINGEEYLYWFSVQGEAGEPILFGIIIAYTVNCDFSNLNRVALPWEQDVPEPQSGGEAGASGERLHPNS